MSKVKVLVPGDESQIVVDTVKLPNGSEYQITATAEEFRTRSLAKLIGSAVRAAGLAAKEKQIAEAKATAAPAPAPTKTK